LHQAYGQYYSKVDDECSIWNRLWGLLYQNGFATLLYDAFEMNGLTSGSDLLLYQMRNSARQRMIYKATLGAYQWVLKNDKVDVDNIFIQGLSNGASVAINMASSANGQHLKVVIAEGAPAAGIGFPNDIHVPLLMIYGSADVYGGTRADDLLSVAMPVCKMTTMRWHPKAFRKTATAMSTAPMPRHTHWPGSKKSNQRAVTSSSSWWTAAGTA
jgi:dienelactone hydrolase